MEKTCKIYKIVDNTNGDIYIGSTTQKLNERLSTHKCKCNYVHKCTSYKIINNGDYKIELIEDIGDVSKEERNTKERYYIENNDCINKNKPGRTRKEWVEENKEYFKEYCEKNKEQIKAYYENNKEQINEKKKEKFTCDCGNTLTYGNKLRHMKSKKHIDYLNTK